MWFFYFLTKYGEPGCKTQFWRRCLISHCAVDNSSLWVLFCRSEKCEFSLLKWLFKNVLHHHVSCPACLLPLDGRWYGSGLWAFRIVTHSCAGVTYSSVYSLAEDVKSCRRSSILHINLDPTCHLVLGIFFCLLVRPVWVCCSVDLFWKKEREALSADQAVFTQTHGSLVESWSVGTAEEVWWLYQGMMMLVQLSGTEWISVSTSVMFSVDQTTLPQISQPFCL